MTAMTDAGLLDGFVVSRDEAAFGAVLDRYGPMVWRVCREILRDPHDAEDAFQATFLVLVRSAGAIRNGDALGRWLYETAYRISLRAKYQSARRDARTKQGVEMVAARPQGDEVEAREMRPALHDEVNRLPSKLRAAIVLCYFEGLSQADAARQLRCPIRTLKGRLARGRELLRSRLSRRGVTVTALMLMLLLTEVGSAAPLELIESTRHAGIVALARRGLPETVPPRVHGLVRGHRRSTFRRRLTALGLAVALGIILANPSLAMILRPGPTGPVAPEPAASAPAPSFRDIHCGASGPDASGPPTACATATPETP